MGSVCAERREHFRQAAFIEGLNGAQAYQRLVVVEALKQKREQDLGRHASGQYSQCLVSRERRTGSTDDVLEWEQELFRQAG